MSRAGEVWDNSVMESFFRSMKTERITKLVYRSREQARADVFDYIERFYNPTRRHSTLGYLSPVQFEKLKSVSAKPAAAHPSSHSFPKPTRLVSRDDTPSLAEAKPCRGMGPSRCDADMTCN